MDFLDGKVALVSGSTRGVGRFIANHLLARGATVVGLARGAATIEAPGYRHFKLDIGDSVAVQRAFQQIASDVGPVAVAINNAAVLTSQYAMIIPVSAAQDMLSANLLGSFLIARESAKMMRKLKWGRIVNVGSMAVSLAPMGDSIYAATKAANMTVMSVLAKEFGPLGITCNTLAITAIETEMLAQLRRDKVDAIVAGLPIARYALEDDILNVLDFFLSERSGYITAQTIWLGGIN